MTVHKEEIHLCKEHHYTRTSSKYERGPDLLLVFVLQGQHGFARGLLACPVVLDLALLLGVQGP